MKIEDDFLEQNEFDELQNLMMSNMMSWFFLDGIDYQDDVKYQFAHDFYKGHIPSLPDCEKLNPILEIINPISIWRIKANLLARTSNIVENLFHVDMTGLSEEKLKQWTTSIFYINTNNGYTKFEDGTKVESVANRMVTFPSNLEHTFPPCTDEKTRVVINFNYFER
jgi:hypothetical protein